MQIMKTDISNILLRGISCLTPPNAWHGTVKQYVEQSDVGCATFETVIEYPLYIKVNEKAEVIYDIASATRKHVANTPPGPERCCRSLRQLSGYLREAKVCHDITRGNHAQGIH